MLRHPDLPTTEAPRSWWLDAQTREDFHEAAQKELLRMKCSKAYSQHDPIVVGQLRKGTR